MKKVMLTSDDFMPLATKIWDFICKELGNEELTLKDFGIILGACESIKFGVQTTLKDMGHDFGIFDMKNKVEQ